MIRKMGTRLLRKCGHEVETAIDGQDALNILIASSGAFDVVLMDMDMPGETTPPC